MKKILLLLTILISASAFSQAMPTALEAWRTTNGTQNFYYKPVTKTDPSGNVIVAGTTLDGATTDILVAKYNAAGNRLWIQQFQGAATGGIDFAAGLFADNNYVYITGGVTNNSVTPETDCVTMKLASSTGSVVWSASYDGAGNFHDAGRHIVVDGSGNVYVSGGSYNASMNTDFLCLKYNSSGVQQWVSTWDYLGFDDAATKGATSGSNLNLTGAVTTATPNVYKVATLSLSQSTGSLLATSVGTAVTTTSVDVVTDFTSDGSGNIIVVGSNNVIGEGNNFYVQKLSNTLVSTWTYTWNGSSSLNDVAKAVELDASGNVYIAGFSTSSTLGKELTLIKLNSSGTFQWLQTSGFSGDDEAADMIIDASSDIYVGGYKTNSTKDYYTAKYDASGTKIWETEMTGLMSDYATNITLDSLSNVIVTGQTEKTPGVFEFTTVKYAQHDMITPTDYNGESPNNTFMYYPNRGQLIGTNDTLIPEVKFYTFNTYPAFYFQNHRQSYVFSKIDTAQSVLDTIQRIDLTFENSLESSEVYSMEEQRDGYLNYYLAHTGEGINGVFGNLRLTTTNLYNNIDLMCSSNKDGIKYYYIIKSGGDMRDIKLEFAGATSYSLDATTNELSINSDIGSLVFAKPVAYQLTAGNATVAVTSFTPSWTTNGGSNKYKFNSGSYTSSLTLVIEVMQQASSPTPNANTQWGTSFMGSAGDAEANDITIDATTGKLYATGYTTSNTFPHTQAVGYQDFKGARDAYVSLFDDYRYKYTTLYGGTDIDLSQGITYDKKNDKVYICGATTGTTSLIMPLSGSATCFTNNSGDYDKCFIARFNAVDGKLEWATRFGMNESYGRKIKADANGNIYVIGRAHFVTTTVTCVANNSPYHPLCDPGGGAWYQWQPLSTWAPQSGSFFYSDGYIARFNDQGALTYSSFFGGWGDEVLTDVHVDDVYNKLYVVGSTYSPFTTDDNCDFNTYTFPICAGSGTFYNRYQLNGDNSTTYCDGFIAKFNLGTMALEGCSYFGGSNEDEITDVVTDRNNNVFITGYSKSSASGGSCSSPNGAFPICSAGGSYTHTPSGGYDTFVAKFTNGGNTLAWSTCLGSSGSDMPTGITVNTNSDDIFVTGNTYSCGFPTVTATSYFNQGAHADYPCSPSVADGFIASFNNNGGLQNSTFFGGKGAGPDVISYGDNISSIAAYQYRVYIGGGTYSTSNFPYACPSAFLPYCTTGYPAGRYRAFYGQISMDAVGIEELNKTHLNKSLTVYPNPTNDKVNVEWENTTSKKAEISIYNLMGQVVSTSNINESIGINKHAIPVSDLKFGLYLVVIKTDNQTLNAKFIKD